VKICVTTLYTDEIAGYGRLAEANKKRYAERRGYDFAAYRSSLDPSRPPSFSKLTAIREALADHDWVFWTDADSLVMNPHVRLESIVRRAGDHDMILTWETGAAPFNAGQWLVRNTPWSLAALAAIAAPDAPNSRPYWFEQGCLVDWLHADPARWQHLRILHPRLMNATPASSAQPGLDPDPSRYRLGDFIVHFWPLGRDLARVQAAMEHYDGLARTAEGSVVSMLRNQAAAARRTRRFAR